VLGAARVGSLLQSIETQMRRFIVVTH
jgi:hypothetical protein